MLSGGFLKSSVLTADEQYGEKLTLMKDEQFAAILDKHGFKSPQEVHDAYCAVTGQAAQNAMEARRASCNTARRAMPKLTAAVA